MKFLAPAALAILFLPTIASAQEECVGFDNYALRLSCYDRAFGRDEVIEGRAEPTAPSDWIVRKETSKMTDDTNVFVSVASDQPVQCNWETKPVRLIVRCLENTTAVLLQTGCHVTSGLGEYGKVTYRIDDNRLITEDFTASTNNRTLGIWNWDYARNFIAELMNGERVVVRFTPYGENPKEASFNISGLSKEIEPLREACGW